MADEMGPCVIVLDIFDDGEPGTVARLKLYYEGFGFMPLPDQPVRLLMPVQTARDLAGVIEYQGAKLELQRLKR